MLVILTFSLYGMTCHWYTTQFGLARVRSDYRVSVHVVGAPSPQFVSCVVRHSGVGDREMTLIYWFRLELQPLMPPWKFSFSLLHFQRGQRSESAASQGVVRIQRLS